MPTKKKTIRKPISYCYNPYFTQEKEIALIEVWQVLEDEVLGTLFPWQYAAGAEMSKRIETLNFLALAQFAKDARRYPTQKFVVKISARMLEEGNVQRLGNQLLPNLILCFDIYSLERFGEKDSLMGLRYLLKRGATVMIDGVERAPIEVLTKYPAAYFLLDYRYYNDDNKGLLEMIKRLADSKGIACAVSSVNGEKMVEVFRQNGITLMAGSALAKARRKLETLLGKSDAAKQEENMQQSLVEAVAEDVVKARAETAADDAAQSLNSDGISPETAQTDETDAQSRQANEAALGKDATLAGDVTDTAQTAARSQEGDDEPYDAATMTRSIITSDADATVTTVEKQDVSDQSSDPDWGL